MGYAEAREACTKLLVELEGDIREYIIGMLEGDESEEEMKEAISEFLLSTGDCADEDEATAVAGLRNDTEGLLFFPAAAAACVAAVLVDMARVPRTAPNAHYRV